MVMIQNQTHINPHTYYISQTYIQESIHEQRACLNESLTFLDNLDSQQSITTFFSHSEMQQATQPRHTFKSPHTNNKHV